MLTEKQQEVLKSHQQHVIQIQALNKRIKSLQKKHDKAIKQEVHMMQTHFPLSSLIGHDFIHVSMAIGGHTKEGTLTNEASADDFQHDSFISFERSVLVY